MIRPTRKPLPSDNYEQHDRETGELLSDQYGREIPDSEPMQPPIGYNRQPSLSEQMRAMIVSHQLAREAAEAGMETFEEADDFEIGDDFEEERHSPYEANFDPMTPEEKAALASQGRDHERILTAAEKARLSPKPKKTKPAGDQPADVKEIGSADLSSEAEGEA